jgi:oxygen-independent coproporphyrinogen-3 oxidase
MSDWQTEIERLVERQPAHVSTYGLTYEKGTAFFAALKAGKLDEIDEEVQRSMYEFAIDRLTLAGYEQYEVSSFAKPGFRSRHNQVYWRGLPFYGFGPGAASYLQGVRRVNHRSPITYMERMLRGESPVDQCDLVNDEAHARDCLVFGLRMREGLDERVFQQDTGFDIYQLGGNALTHFLAQGWMQRKEGRLLLTRSGLLISDSLWPELIVG